MKAPLIIRRVVGHSMWPTLSSGDIILATPWLSIKLGSVVVVRTQGHEFIKRVDSLTPDNRLRLLGDNYYHSHDSRSFGPVARSQILGVVIGYPRGLGGKVRSWQN